MATYSSIAQLNSALVRKALTGGFYVAPYSATMINRTNLLLADGSLAGTLPAGWTGGGLMTPEGIRMARAQETESIDAWQSLSTVREDRTSDSETAQVDFLETKRTTIELFTGADLSAYNTAGAAGAPPAAYVNKAISIQKPALPTDRFYRSMSLLVDNVDGLEFYVAVLFPRVKATSWNDQAFQKSGGFQWGMTFTSFNDAQVGYAKETIIGGPGYAALATAMGFLAP